MSALILPSSVVACPNCGSTALRVLKTTTLTNHEVVRYRRCHDCGWRFASRIADRVEAKASR